MNIEQIRELAGIIKENKLESIEVKCEDIEIKIKASPSGYAAARSDGGLCETEADGGMTIAERIKGSLHEVTSPMVGVFYAAPAPDKEPFVKVGSRVAKGDVLCIIEAMKLMNEITAEHDGEIAEICVENGQVVEYGQTLFSII